MGRRLLVLSALIAFVWSLLGTTPSGAEDIVVETHDIDRNGAHTLTVTVNTEVLDGNDCFGLACVFEPPEVGPGPRTGIRSSGSIVKTVELDLVTGLIPLHDPDAQRREWWRGPFIGSDGLGLMPLDDDVSVCFNFQEGWLSDEANNAFLARTTVGFFVGGRPCEPNDLKAQTELSVGAPPNGAEVCSPWWEAEYTDDFARAQICLRNDRIDPQPIAGPVAGNAGPAPFTATWDMSPSIIVGNNPTWSWDWGDGTMTTGDVVASHVYTVPGVYPVTLTIDDGGIVRSAVVGVVTVHVPPTGPQAVLIGPGNAFGLIVLFDASASQPASGQGGAIAEYWWDLGDGTLVITRNPDSTLVHTYAQPGVYTVTVTIHTANGLTSTAQTTVTVITRP